MMSTSRETRLMGSLKKRDVIEVTQESLVILDRHYRGIIAHRQRSKPQAILNAAFAKLSL